MNYTDWCFIFCDRMNDKVEAPSVVSCLSWVDRHSTEENLSPEALADRPEVQKYCIVSAEDSYINFHIDTEGSSLYFYVHKVRVLHLLPNEAMLFQ